MSVPQRFRLQGVNYLDAPTPGGERGDSEFPSSLAARPGRGFLHHVAGQLEQAISMMGAFGRCSGTPGPCGAAVLASPTLDAGTCLPPTLSIARPAIRAIRQRATVGCVGIEGGDRLGSVSNLFSDGDRFREISMGKAAKQLLVGRFVETGQDIFLLTRCV